MSVHYTFLSPFIMKDNIVVPLTAGQAANGRKKPVCYQLFLASKSFMNSTSFSTPSMGIAL
ncbi:MAG TPA: hypothetical protein DEO95_06530 [Ruminococcaceae bacterium]|nr:hypothetical protein [Oscillospiraceae bacterium]